MKCFSNIFPQQFDCTSDWKIREIVWYNCGFMKLYVDKALRVTALSQESSWAWITKQRWMPWDIQKCIDGSLIIKLSLWTGLVFLKGSHWWSQHNLKSNESEWQQIRMENLCCILDSFKQCTALTASFTCPNVVDVGVNVVMKSVCSSSELSFWWTTNGNSADCNSAPLSVEQF